jgi:hypothetical protein
MKDHEIVDLYWSRNEATITATADTDGNYCYCIAYNIQLDKNPVYFALHTLQKDRIIVAQQDIDRFLIQCGSLDAPIHHCHAATSIPL